MDCLLILSALTGGITSPLMIAFPLWMVLNPVSQIVSNSAPRDRSRTWTR